MYCICLILVERVNHFGILQSRTETVYGISFWKCTFFKGGNKCDLLSKIICKFSNHIIIVYAHGRRLCSNWFRHGSTTISNPQCILTFMPERSLHRCHEQSLAILAYAMSAVGIDVVSDHKLFAYRVVSSDSTDIMSSHTKYCRIAYGITR